MNTQTKILVSHPFDPLGNKIGGIQTFIKNLIMYAPQDLEISLVGISSNKELREVGKWQKIEVFGREINFLPVLFLKEQNKRSFIPLSLKFTINLLRYRKVISVEGKILEFHRVSAIAFLKNLKNSVIVVHGNMSDLRNKNTEVKWRGFSWFYFFIEKRIMPHVKRVFVVRRDGVDAYRERFPLDPGKFLFLPTWVDPNIFYPFRAMKDKENARKEFLKDRGLAEESKLIVFAGRLEGQKDPLLLIDTFSYVKDNIGVVHLVVIGTGSLKKDMETRVRSYGLENNVSFMGVLCQEEMSSIMRIADVFLLTSAFEGMPRSVLESLSCGTPVVTTNAGEVGLVVKQGVSGFICKERTPVVIGQAVLDVLLKEGLSLENCVGSIREYTAESILARFYGELRGISAGKNAKCAGKDTDGKV